MSATQLAPDTSADALAPEVVEHLGAGWDTVVAQFADACLEQTAGFAAARWDTSRLSGLLLRNVATGEVEAAALAVVFALPMVKAGLAYFKFGPMWRRKDKPAQPRVLASMLDAVKREYALARGLLVRVLPPAEPEQGAAWDSQLRQSGFRHHRDIDHAGRHLVNLQLSPQEQRQSLGAKWRANLAKAEKSGVVVDEIDPVRGAPLFLSLYRSMSDRKRFDDRHGIEDFETLVARAQPGSLRLFVGSHRGEPVAASLIAGTGERLGVPFSATGPRALELRAGYALRWAVIDRLRNSGARWLDLGGHEGDDGLRHFKEGNVGKRGVIVPIPGEYDYCTSRASAAASSALELARVASQFHPLRQLRNARRPHSAATAKA